MKTEIVVTDLTRMYRGNVCIAGYDATRRCIRPVLPPPGIHQDTIVLEGRPLVYPFAVIELDLLEQQPRLEPPHIEDRFYDPSSLRFRRHLPEAGRRNILAWSLYTRMGHLFGQPPLHGPGHYVMEGQGVRSLGTIQPEHIQQVIYEQDVSGSWDYRLRFNDVVDEYRLKIVDLTWHYYCDCLRGQGKKPTEIATFLTDMLMSREVFLRIGLSRGWARYPNRCYLQVTGIHTLPDYLEGRTFVDLQC